MQRCNSINLSQNQHTTCLLGLNTAQHILEHHHATATTSIPIHNMLVGTRTIQNTQYIAGIRPKYHHATTPTFLNINTQHACWDHTKHKIDCTGNRQQHHTSQYQHHVNGASVTLSWIGLYQSSQSFVDISKVNWQAIYRISSAGLNISRYNGDIQ